MNNRCGLVSILMNAYNSERYLKEAIDSVYSQSYSNWEIIFVDNCSVDSTYNIVKQYDSKIKYYKTSENYSLGTARNVGLNLCNGEFIAFLDTDDVWVPKKLEMQVKLLNSNLNCNVCYSGGEYIDELGHVIKTFMPKISTNVFPHLLRKYDINLQTVLIRASVKFKFSDNKQYCEDFDAFMKILSHHSAQVLEEKLVYYRVHTNSLTFNLKERWHVEFRESLNELIQLNPELYTKYKHDFKIAYSKADYYEGRYLKEELHQNLTSFQKVIRNSHLDYRYFIIGIIFLMPNSIWQFIRRKMQF